MRATFTLDANNRLCLDHQPESPEEELLLRLWRASREDGGQLARARALLEKLLAREVGDIAEGIEALNDLRRSDRRLEQDVAVAADEAEPAGPAEAPTDRPRRKQVSAEGREKMRLHARPSPESMRAMRDLAAKGRSAEEIAAREWLSAAGAKRRFGLPIIKNILRGGGGDQTADDDSDDEPVPARRPPPHPDCRGVLAVIEEPAWLRPGSRIPMPSYAGSWAFPARRTNSRNA
jgi:hypothetical protein